MTSQFPHLLSPYRIGSHVFKNRILAAPTGTLHKNPEGYMHRDYLDYCRVLIEGGAARISTLDNPVDPVYGGRGGARRFWLYQDPLSQDLIDSFEEYNRMAHACGVLTMPELSHQGKGNMGEPGYDELMTTDTALVVSPEEPGRSPRGTGGPGTFGGMPPGGPKMCTKTRTITPWDIETIAGQFASCARALQKLGCDGVIIHGGHGQLFTQFLSTGTNRRTDQYGGSLDDRMRAPLQILREVRKACGPDFLIELRVSAVSEGEMPIRLEETVELAKAVDGLVDIFHVSSSCGTISTSAEYPVGLNAAYAAEIKKHVTKTAVAVVGAINDPTLAEEIIASGKADFVCSGRQLHLSDPHWPKKLMEGRPEMIDNCLRCSTGCNGDFLCAVNPVRQSALPTELAIHPAERPKKVVVIGAGPAGMKAAEIAARRGHHVILMEKASVPGGTLRFADADPTKTETALFRDSLARRIVALGVDLRLSTTATPALVAAESPDAVIAALGARQNSAVPGADRNAMAAYGAPLPGNRIAVIGAGLTGVETALHLKRQNPQREVLLIEKENRALPALIGDGGSDFLQKTRPGGHYNPSELVRLLKEENITVLLCAEVSSVTEHGVLLQNGGLIPCDTAITATGVTPLTDPAESFRGIAPLFYNVGDSAIPGTIRDAVYAAYRAAMSL